MNSSSNQQVQEIADSTLHEIAGNTILCLIDFSDASQYALRWATAMTRTLGAHLTILYSYRLLVAKTEALQMKKQTELDALQKFLEWESEVLANKDIDYDFRSEVGFFSDRVDAYVKRNQVSMLVIHRAMIDGSGETVQQLVEHLKVPLVIIP